MLIAVLTEAGGERAPCSEQGFVLVVVIWVYFDILRFFEISLAIAFCMSAYFS